MSKHNVIFVGGVHGVGKSSCCAALASALKIEHFSAGTLIKQHRELGTDKRVSDVRGNQKVLTEALRLLKTPNSGFLLDGHFCVLNACHDVERIEIETFRELGLSGALVLLDDVHLIVERLKNRDGITFPLTAVAALQEAEKEHALAVCTELKIELLTATPLELPKLRQFVSERLIGQLP